MEIKDIVIPTECLGIDKLKEYKNNAKIHTRDQIEEIKTSITRFGMIDPIGTWGKENIIVEGHGRLIACKELGIKKVLVIRLDHLTDEERKAYALVHNKLTMNTGLDKEKCKNECDDISFDMSDFGFNDIELEINEENEENEENCIDDDDDEENPYTQKIDIPQYQITGECPKIHELYDTKKVEELRKIINKSKVSKEQKEFLNAAITRFFKFDFQNIAEYYAHQNNEMQELMEKLALVIIDFDNAIKNGYVILSNNIDKIVNGN